MSEKQIEELTDLTSRMASVTADWPAYWSLYSNMGTWQFWVNLLILLVPLLFLAFALDRKTAFRVGFYGLLVHMTFTYIDAFGTTHGLWEYPYKLLPFLPVSFGLDASLVPVSYMLVYQWVLKSGKNYYVYAGALSLFFSFVFKPLLTYLDLFQLYRGMNYWLLCLGYITIALLSKWITDLFAQYQMKAVKGT